MLTDSTTNEEESKGFFQFRIKSLMPFSEASSIENVASIYFDFNDPIVTNTAITSAPLLNGTNEHLFPTSSIYPNPATKILNVELARNSEANLELLSVTSQVIFTKSVSENQSENAQLNISELARGVYYLRVNQQGIVRTFKVMLE